MTITITAFERSPDGSPVTLFGLGQPRIFETSTYRGMGRATSSRAGSPDPCAFRSTSFAHDIGVSSA
jgi:hypothetical protein